MVNRSLWRFLVPTACSVRTWLTVQGATADFELPRCPRAAVVLIESVLRLLELAATRVLPLTEVLPLAAKV